MLAGHWPTPPSARGSRVCFTVCRAQDPRRYRRYCCRCHHGRRREVRGCTSYLRRHAGSRASPPGTQHTTYGRLLTQAETGARSTLYCDYSLHTCAWNYRNRLGTSDHVTLGIDAHYLHTCLWKLFSGMRATSNIKFQHCFARSLQSVDSSSLTSRHFCMECNCHIQLTPLHNDDNQECTTFS